MVCFTFCDRDCASLVVSAPLQWSESEEERRTTRRAKRSEGFFSPLIGRRRDNQLFNFCAGKKSSCGGGKEGDADIALQVGSEILFYGLSAAKVRH